MIEMEETLFKAEQDRNSEEAMLVKELVMRTEIYAINQKGAQFILRVDDGENGKIMMENDILVPE